MFHQSSKQRTKNNQIHSIQTSDGIWSRLQRRYKRLLFSSMTLFGSKMTSMCSIMHVVFDQGNILTDRHRQQLLCSFSEDDLKKVMNSIPNNKDPGLDGSNSQFFKATWSIVHKDIYATVIDFLRTGKILKTVNVTSITLVLKVNVSCFYRELRTHIMLYNYLQMHLKALA